jgi:hypothetical protein
MPLRITLSDHDTVELTVSLDDWNRAYQRAIQNGTMVEIQEPSGRIISINPQRVLLLETVDESNPDPVDHPAAEPQIAGI